MELPNKKYKIIYADPAWKFENYSDKWHKNRKESRWVENVYSCMTFEDMCKLPVKNISYKDSICLMWVTFPKLKEGIALLEIWGFEYKTNVFTWIKKNKKSDSLFWGMGYYTRANAEICILGTKGKVLPRLSHKVHSVIISKIREHSRKPEEARNKIVELFGDLPRIELFARTRTEGWDAWGNEVPKECQKLLRS